MHVSPMHSIAAQLPGLATRRNKLKSDWPWPSFYSIDNWGRLSRRRMTKRKIGLFFVIAIAVFITSRGTHVRHADAAAVQAGAVPAPVTSQR